MPFKKNKFGLVAITMLGAFMIPAFVSTANAGSFSSAPVGSANIDAATNGYVNTNYHYKRGAAHFNAKEYSKASQSFRRVLRQIPYDANTNYYMATIKTLTGQDKRAIPYYRKALKQYDDNAVLMVGLAVSYARVNKRDKAKAILNKLEYASAECERTCEEAPIIAGALLVVSEALITAE